MKLLKGILPGLALLAFNAASCSSMFVNDVSEHADVDELIENHKVITSNSNSAGYTSAFKVTWKRGDEVLKVDYNVPIGTTPYFEGNPSYSDSDYQYNFVKWEPELAPITKDMTYSAVYNIECKYYILNPINNSNGDTVAYSVGGFASEDLATLNIPSSFAGLPVTRIDEEAFMDKKSIVNVNIPDSVKTISGYAFKGCTSLQNLNLGNGVSSIGDNSFASCNNLRLVKFPNTLKTIGNSAFMGANLEEVNLPDSVEKIGSLAFYNGNTPIRRLRLPNNGVVIDKYTFSSDKIASISLPKDFYTRCEYTKDIKYNMFSPSTKISYINYDGSISEYNEKINSKISRYADYDYSIFSKASVIENSYEDKDTFENNANKKIIVWKDYNGTITHYTYSNGVDDYPGAGQVPTRDKDDSYQYTFNKWDITADSTLNVEERRATYTAETRKYELVFKLANGETISQEYNYNDEVTFPSEVKDTEDSYFLGWDKDEFTNMPAEDITINALYSRKDAVGLSYITDNKTVGFQSFESLVSNNRLKTSDNGKTVYNSEKDKYSNYVAFEKFNEGGNLVLPSNITKIDALQDTKLRNIRIPEGVTHIEEISNHSELSKLELPSTLASVGVGAFRGYLGVKVIDLSNTQIETLANNAFQSNQYVEKIIFGNSIKTFGTYICYSCPELKEVVFGSGATSTGESMFFKCHKLEKISWGSINTIGKNTFGEANITSITIPNQITTISSSAFALCSELENVVFGNRIETIGSSAFLGCNKLTNVEIPSSVKRIERYAFAESGLRTIIVPTSVTYLDLSAFLFNNNTIEILYKGSKSQWESIDKNNQALPTNCSVTYNY